MHTSIPAAGAWLTVQQAVDYLQISKATLYEAIAAGHLRAVKINGNRVLRIKREWCDAWMESYEITSPPVQRGDACEATL